MAGKLGIIGGTGLVESHLFRELTAQTIQTPYGEALVAAGPGVVFVQRHGPRREVPPHRINHRANLSAMQQLGVGQILAFNSTGSLKPDLPPGHLVIPHDFFSPWSIPTFFDETCRHVVPEISETLRKRLIAAAETLQLPHRATGVYVHALGPRFETPSEIHFLSQVGHVVGMTAGQEIPLANELDIPYALACMVDNFANGISPEPLTTDQVMAAVRQNQTRVEALLQQVLSNILE